MSGNVSKASLDEEATSRTSPKAYQPNWLSHWTNKKPEVSTTVNDSSFLQTQHNNKLVEFGANSDASPSKLISMPNGFSRYGKGVLEDSKDLEFGTANLSLSLALGRTDNSTDLNLRNESMLQSKGKQAVSKYCLPTHRSKKTDTSSPVVVFEKHFSNDNFTCFSKDSCKYKKYSSFLLHETDMKNNLSYEASQSVDKLTLPHGKAENMKFPDFFGKKHGKSRLSENVSLRNVETMRICTMVDSMENSPEGYNKISQRAHHVLFTKEMCSNLPDDKTFGPFNVSQGFPPSRPSGVKIQPLWTSTESEEKENTGNSSVFKTSSKNEASVENEAAKENAPQSRYTTLPGMTSSLAHKYNGDGNISTTMYNSKTDKNRNKMPLPDIPDINKELPGVHVQPVSSPDDEGPSTSRVRSVNAKQLFSNKNVLNHSCNDNQDHFESPEASIKCTDPGNRWIKRLKCSSSDSIGVGTKSSPEEDSSHEKFNMFFNKVMDPKLLERHGKEHYETEQNSKSVLPKRDHNSMMNGCSWIQRWCQNKKVSRPKNPEPVVICEPHSLKVGLDELAKKQFPSIGALALMGKAMNGYRACEFSKKGSVVVWNTRES